MFIQKSIGLAGVSSVVPKAYYLLCKRKRIHRKLISDKNIFSQFTTEISLEEIILQLKALGNFKPEHNANYTLVAQGTIIPISRECW